MISLRLARRLKDAGLRWTPASGDRFVVADRGMDDDVFVLADMTVDVHRLPHGAGYTEVIGFNGTTEWALDSVQQQDTVWLPSEGQLRELLAGTFRRLERDGDGWRIDTVVNGRASSVSATDPAEAYGLALLALITGDVPEPAMP